MVFVHETHVMPSSGKVKTKRQLFSYLVLAGSECCPMCQLLQTGTNYHITYIWMVPVAPIFWHYIDWWCLFMKHMWCHLVAKYKLKGICSHTSFLQVVRAARFVSCSKQKQICSKQEQISYLLLAATGCTHLVALYWLMVFIHETHVMPSSGQVKTKRHLFSYFVIAGSESCPMCQLLQTGTNYHITYIWLVLLAPIFWHYIDWWCLFIKHMSCHTVAK